MHVSLEGGEVGSTGPNSTGENDEAGIWDTERQVDGPTDRPTVSASGSAVADGIVHQKPCSTSMCCDRETRKQNSVVCAKCVCLLSKWSCLCLKVDCKLVLSLETEALISVWLCWLSFSSISTVQQEKPCGHTFNGAPARDKENICCLMPCDPGKLSEMFPVWINKKKRPVQNAPAVWLRYHAWASRKNIYCRNVRICVNWHTRM